MAEHTPFDFIQDATRSHRRQHGCGAYTFEDGAGLIATARQHNPSRVLELGTALGFTACCLASAGDRTRVDTIEADPDHAALARNNIRKANLDNRITVHEGDFLAIMPRLDGPYYLAFFDGFSPDLRIIEHLRDLLGKDGVLICANLSLTGARERRLLDAEFRNVSRWSPIGQIEDGATQVFRKATGT
jgi:predicted O-methyltransferase YrrM